MLGKVLRIIHAKFCEVSLRFDPVLINFSLRCRAVFLCSFSLNGPDNWFVRPFVRPIDLGLSGPCTSDSPVYRVLERFCPCTLVCPARCFGRVSDCPVLPVLGCFLVSLSPLLGWSLPLVSQVFWCVVSCLFFMFKCLSPLANTLCLLFVCKTHLGRVATWGSYFMRRCLVCCTVFWSWCLMLLLPWCVPFQWATPSACQIHSCSVDGIQRFLFVPSLGVVSLRFQVLLFTPPLVATFGPTSDVRAWLGFSIP